ncbi:MAG: DUF2924 domain-containing protein [bacterium]
MKDSLLSQIKELEKMSVSELKKKYTEAFGSDKGVQTNKTYLIKRITHKIQENEFGGLKQETKDKINNLAFELNPINNLGKIKNERGTENGNKGRNNKRLPLPGTLITKTYKGNLIEIRVLEKGFEYKGKTYKSISALAKEISGIHCSGFAFFNL